MRYWIFLLLILAVAILQSSALDLVRIWNVKPDIMFSVVVIVSLLLEFRLAIIFSIVSGIFKDSLGINYLAINTFLFPLWSLLILQVAKRMPLEGNLRQVTLIFIVVILNSLACRLFFFSTTVQIPFGIFARTLLLESIYTTLLTQGIFIFVSNRLSLKEAFKQDRGPDLESEIE